MQQLISDHKLLRKRQWRVQEFVRGGGENLNFFFVFQYFKGGPAQKIADKMIFPTKKVAKYKLLCFNYYMTMTMTMTMK